MLIDANDSPPVCESSVYRASLDEGAGFFDPPLFIKVRDADSIADISYRLIASDDIQNLFDVDKHTGQLIIKNTAALDVNHLKSETLYFGVEVKQLLLFEFTGRNKIVWVSFLVYGLLYHV